MSMQIEQGYFSEKRCRRVVRTKVIELSNYIAKDLYLYAKQFNAKYSESLPVRIRTDIYNPFGFDDAPCFDFCIEFVKMPFIARAKTPLYVDMLNGSVVKRAANGSWQRLLLDMDSQGNDYARWFKSDWGDENYLADDSLWIKATFDEGLLNQNDWIW